MPSSPSISSIIAAFPAIQFHIGDEFRWVPAETTIYYNETDPRAIERLLHEIAHAELGHQSYDRDIELIALERDAWNYAKITLAPQLNTAIDANTIEDDLDTYRDWLHARSTCPVCSATGIQTSAGPYRCIACQATWRVNHAIGCQLRRYQQK